MMKKLVAYFSASDMCITKTVAEKLAAAAGADLFEIKPQVPYTKEELDWTDKNSRSSLECRDKSSRPAITDTVKNPKDYDIIFLGFPIWWYTAPPIVKTFLESADFSGCKIAIFATSGGSGMGNTAGDIKEICPPSARIIAAKRLKRSAEKEIAEFARVAEEQ
ncbi:MAG: NAD(P)H-dependent oxidoreductase [Synergistes sp.]|nr:NAD(P)H-dependent oxidoreductase [Synergistes sp.]MCR5336556.1 NAD(P)H-dependent oxidoreductase [Synergistes sp.]